MKKIKNNLKYNKYQLKKQWINFKD
jgi:hypothetical protein